VPEIKEIVSMEENALVTMNGIPDDLQQKIRNSMIGEEDRNKGNSENDTLLSTGVVPFD